MNTKHQTYSIFIITKEPIVYICSSEHLYLLWVTKSSDTLFWFTAFYIATHIYNRHGCSFGWVCHSLTFSCTSCFNCHFYWGLTHCLIVTNLLYTCLEGEGWPQYWFFSVQVAHRYLAAVLTPAIVGSQRAKIVSIVPLYDGGHSYFGATQFHYAASAIFCITPMLLPSIFIPISEPFIYCQVS